MLGTLQGTGNSKMNKTDTRLRVYTQEKRKYMSVQITSLKTRYPVLPLSPQTKFHITKSRNQDSPEEDSLDKTK